MLALVAAVLLTPRSDSLEVFRVDTLAPGVYAALVLSRPDAYAFANSLVVVGDDGALVVDTQQSPTAASVLVRRVRAMTDVPVRWVVNTHWHADHVYGNQSWAEAYPGAHFVAHETTREDLLTLGRDQLREQLEIIPPSIREREGWLASGTGPGGDSLTAEDREAVSYSLRLRRSYLEDLRRVRQVLPDVTFRDRVTLELGGRRVEVIHLGPAHTRGDVVVWLPDLGIVAAGDLVEVGTPWLEGADISGWADALERLKALHASVVLPAHGGVQRDGRLLEGDADFFRDLVSAVREGLARGRSDDEVVRGADLSASRAFFGDMGIDEAAFDEFREQALRQALAELRPPPGGSRQ